MTDMPGAVPEREQDDTTTADPCGFCGRAAKGPPEPFCCEKRRRAFTSTHPIVTLDEEMRQEARKAGALAGFLRALDHIHEFVVVSVAPGDRCARCEVEVDQDGHACAECLVLLCAGCLQVQQ